MSPLLALFAAAGLSRAGALDALPSLTGPGVGQGPTVAIPAGDLNGDGLGDLAVGVPADDGGAGHESGAVYLILDVAALTPFTPISDAGVALRGETAQAYAGSDLAALGDTDGDGLGDLAIGAPEASIDGKPAVGKVYILTGANTPVVDGELGALPYAHGVEEWGRLGARVYATGDVNNDERADLAVGAPYPTPSGDVGVGYAALLLTPEGGFSGTTRVTVEYSAAGTRTTTADEVWLYFDSGTLFGRALAVMPDLNGDTRPDWLIAAPGIGMHDHGAPPPPDTGRYTGADGVNGHSTGSVYLFAGRSRAERQEEPFVTPTEALGEISGVGLEELAWIIVPTPSGGALLAAPESERVYYFTTFTGSQTSDDADGVLQGFDTQLSGWGLALWDDTEPAVLLSEPGHLGGLGRVALLPLPEGEMSVQDDNLGMLDGCQPDGLAGASVRSASGPDPKGEDRPWAAITAPRASARAWQDGLVYVLTADSTAWDAECAEVLYPEAPDNDGDGFVATEDCDDAAAWRYPGAPEVCSDGVDDDCDAVADQSCGPALEDKGCGACSAGDGSDNTPWLALGAALAIGLRRRGKLGALLVAGGLGVSADVHAQSLTDVDASAAAILTLQGSGAYEFVHGPVRSGVLDGQAVLAVGNYQGTSVLHSAGEVQLLPMNELGGVVDLLTAPVTLHGEEEHDYFGVDLTFSEEGLLVGADKTGLTEREPGVVSLWTSPLATPGVRGFYEAELLLTGDGNSDAFGRQLAVGDLNGDGAEDWALAAPQQDRGELLSAGTVWILHGGSGGAVGEQRVRDLATASIGGDRLGAGFGWRLLAPGDLDGDGQDDLIVGDLSGPTTLGGRLHVYTEVVPGDTNAPVGAWSSSTANDRAGEGLAAGDLDSDGALDVMIGSAAHGRGNGRLWWVRGAPAGQIDLDDAAVATMDGVGAEGRGASLAVGPSLLVGAPFGDRVLSLDETFTPAVSLRGGDELGAWVSWVSDLDGDGVQEAVMVAPKAEVTRESQGIVWALSGVSLLDGELPAWGVSEDLDGDGVGEEEDCDDADPRRSPALDEVCRDDVDNNCDWRVDESPCLPRGCAVTPSAAGGLGLLGAVTVGLLRRRRATAAIAAAALLAGCAPELTLSLPTSPASGEITLGVSGNVDQLALYVDGVVIGGGPGPALAVPFDTTSVADGVYDVLGEGFIGSRDAYTVTGTFTVQNEGLDTVAPEVSFVQPLDGGVVGLGGETLIVLDVEDAPDLASVSVLLDGTLLGELPLGGPYELLWTPASEGAAVLTAEVTDGSGNLATARAVVSVAGEVSDLTCTLSSPRDESTVSPGVVQVKAAVASSSGVKSVEFWANGVMIAMDTASPWQAEWTASEGAATLSIVATDGAGATCEDSVSVNVVAGSDAITARITRPTDGSTIFGVNAPVNVAAGGGAGVREVRIYVDELLVATDTEAPYELRLDTTTIEDGAHTLTAEAEETGTGATASDSISVTIDNG
ncbi:Ig-like domain-containing protein [Myxococcota bacterium]|nr:Ig-like domain-containing protein [Myxococcota bacterium]